MPTTTGERAGAATAGLADVARRVVRLEGDGVPRGVIVGGIAPFTTTDFPGRLAAVLFLQGCPWRCGYCHNPHLVPARRDPDESSREHAWDDVLAFLRSRQGLLDGVVFSGGEPTAQPGLADAMREVRSLGFAIGLHTGGAYPRRLASVLPLVDWVGFDAKAPTAQYPLVTGIDGSGIAAFASLRLLLDSAVAHEIRTTVHSALVPDAALLRLAEDLAELGIRRWVLQPFRPAGCGDALLVAAAPGGASIDGGRLGRLREQVPEVTVRG
jgi:pyruvate formate lyase activating enzyme